MLALKKKKKPASNAGNIRDEGLIPERLSTRACKGGLIL